jgi:hypothetical protein
MAAKRRETKLMAIWRDIFKCRRCDLAKGYTPQFRPVGTHYRRNGVMFAQINPREMLPITKAKINEKYKTESSKKRVRDKRRHTKNLLSLQRNFAITPNDNTWRQMCEGFYRGMINVWGWPPGKFCETIEKHGVKPNAAAFVNLALCPVPDDRCGNKHFNNCWEPCVLRLINALRPSIIVAQGKRVYRFLGMQQLPSWVTVVEGVHHASRRPKEKKEELFKNVKRFLV